MASKKPKREPVVIDINQLREMRQTKVRHGRARLTISRSGSIIFSEVEPVLNAWRQGNKTDEDLAWTFVRSRVVNHTPSFKWNEADLDRLIALVTATSKEPKLKSKTAEDLARELDQLEVKEQELWKKSSAKFRKQMSAFQTDWTGVVGPSLNQGFAKSLQNLLPAMEQSPLGKQLQEIQGLNPNFTRVIRNSSVEQLLPQAKMVDAINLRWDELSQRPIVELMEAKSFRPDTSPLWRSLREVIVSDVAKDALTGPTRVRLATMVGDQNFPGLANELASLARTFAQPETAEAMAVTVEVVEEVESGADPEALAEAIANKLRPSFDALEKAVGESQSTAVQMLLLMVAAALLTILVQMFLAKYGIYVLPPEPPK